MVGNIWCHFQTTFWLFDHNVYDICSWARIFIHLKPLLCHWLTKKLIKDIKK